MNKTIKEILGEIGKLEKEDLELLRSIVLNGELLKNIDELIDRKNNAKCSVCEAPLGKDYYELRWMSHGLLKRARFDGLDCLAYFIAALRNRKDERIRRVKP
ncbi:hypothetical protein J7K74_01595 [Candidatus Woesearchaeota archaeon]|nr:hypothetical protein [Candidatus Woesearchaeota archaeon]